MAVAFDTSAKATWDANSKSFSYTTTTSDDRWMMITIGSNLQTSDNHDITAITYNGVSLTEAWDDSNYVAGEWYHIWVWSLVAPATGANTVSITCVDRRYNLGMMTFSGVDQINPTTATAQQEAENSVYSISVASDANGILAVGSSGLDFWGTYGAGQTERQDQSGVAVSTEAGDGGNVTVNATANGTVGAHAYVYSLQPVQNVTVDLSGQAVSATATAHIGGVDDGNITLSNIPAGVVAATAHIGATQVSQVITADMVLYT